MFRRRAGKLGWVALYGVIAYMVMISALGVFAR